MGLINTIRTTARTTSKVMNFCLNPACLHGEAVKGCTCCSRGHGKKSKAKTSSRSKARTRR